MAGNQQLQPLPDTTSSTTFPDMIRSWVHFDNLAATFNRQVQQARSARYRWEQQIITYLQQHNMTNHIIQINGGRITLNNEKHSQPLTLQRLELLLHDYYYKKGARPELDETKQIMEFIRANREVVIETKLKKS